MKVICIILFLFMINITIAQDSHYSQFDKTVALLNPALISHQKTSYELQLQRRSQWGSVTLPFNTTAISFNAKKIYSGVSAGVIILNDIAGDSRFSTKGGGISVAKSFNIQENSLSFGFQAALYQRAVSFDNLFFLENEQLQNVGFPFFDIGIGVSNYKRIDNSSAFLIGSSLYHINKPRQTLTSDPNLFLNPKHIIHATFYNTRKLKTEISPTIYFSLQDKSRETIIGSGIRYKINNRMSLKSGIYNRVQDAFFIVFGIKKENLDLTISYDINISSLSRASNTIGAFEASISYGWDFKIKEKQKKEPICPKYL